MTNKLINLIRVLVIFILSYKDIQKVDSAENIISWNADKWKHIATSKMFELFSLFGDYYGTVAPIGEYHSHERS
ncbi:MULTISPECIES: hypothetical protein [unclassified Clostridium]|uniref:hypothetical protein n=1 Tax=unclassified Clostridium TaxID=2614128 RepID=UPI00189737FE|nr:MULTISPECIES: hypothetical protein [unclassified Clostridium]MCR1950789.1 hypothetical protein [Clostridium sp. DSM 100503]